MGDKWGKVKVKDQEQEIKLVLLALPELPVLQRVNSPVHSMSM